MTKFKKKTLNLFFSVSQSLKLAVIIIVIGIQFLINKLAVLLPPLSQLNIKFDQIISRLSFDNQHSISIKTLIKLATKNMQVKKTRTYVTVGGMTLGIAAIVFLVSIGYGLQELVINRVARLEEMKQIDVSVPPGSNLKINDQTLAEIKKINHIDTVSPMISLVAKASYEKSSSDLVAYGVTTDYLKQSAIAPVIGRMFDSNQLTASTNYSQLTETNDQSVQEENQVEFTIEPGEWLRVRNQADPNGQLLGYTKNNGSSYLGKEVEGKNYIDDEKIKNTWIQAELPLWEKEDDTYNIIASENGSQLKSSGYVAELFMKVDEYQNKLENVDTQILEKENSDQNLPPHREVVVNKSTLDLLGINQSEALDKSFSISFIATGDLLANKNEKIISDNITYNIIGVTPDQDSPILYVPFVNLRSLGLVNFSQLKIVVDDANNLEKIRQQIETIGFNTSSVADTVEQINAVFATARTMLVMLGMIALAVASLGMFNTLTISLLERTHEVGLMKAMGMTSEEVKILFLAESMIMGFLGGILGLIFGFTSAKILEILISTYGIIMGVGYLNMVSIPLIFTLMIIFLSLMVGLFTGIFPAKRATKISALDALRYE